jgi:sugar lactone lactonase YvrE
VLAADSHGRAIRRYDATGRFLNDIGRNNRTGGFAIPNGVLDFSVDAGGTIHAANPGKHRIERYTPDGTLLGHIGRFGGLDPAGFSGCCNPTNVCVGNPPSIESQRIYVTEKAGPRVKVHDFDGTLLSVIATDGFDANCKNMDLAVDTRGAVYVVDTVRLEIRVFEPEAAA